MKSWVNIIRANYLPDIINRMVLRGRNPCELKMGVAMSVCAIQIQRIDEENPRILLSCADCLPLGVHC